MSDILPNGTLVRVTDPANFYNGELGAITDSLDGRPLGGKVAYTVEIKREGRARISFAASADKFEVEAQPWESLAGLRGTADRCTCSDDQLALVGCDCDAQQNLPIQCDCGVWLREQVEIESRACRSCINNRSDPPEPEPSLWLGPEFADDISLEERWEHYAFEERYGMPYGSSF